MQRVAHGHDMEYKKGIVKLRLEQTMPQRLPSIKELVQGFASHIGDLNSKGYPESQVRLQYIDRFWTILGWDVENSRQLAPQDADVLVEPTIDTLDEEGFKPRKPDYLFRVNGFPRFIVEAKKPSIDLDKDRDAVYQAKRYAWSAAIPFAILMNFERFRLYDTTLEPFHKEPGRGLVEEFALSFEDYVTQWDALLGTFGREVVAKGSLEELRIRLRKSPARKHLWAVDRLAGSLKGDEPVDQKFLDFLEVRRKIVARDIYSENKKDFPDAETLHGAARLTEAVQRILDRLVFIRVCEDRNVSAWGGLHRLLERVGRERQGNLYETLCSEFRDLDREYNGYLFKYHFSESLRVHDEVIADLIASLYPPKGSWDFCAIGDDILGIVYERFLGSTVAVERGSIEIREKPEVRHAGGVYYTPRFIVDTIIRRVIGPKLKGKSPIQVLDIKILDPACGSGSFLVAAFQYIIDHCLAAIKSDEALATIPASPKARKKRKEIAFKGKKGEWQLAPDFRAALLTSCIHGVDIDQQAVEVTIMSLYLKMLEGDLPTGWQKDWLENLLLPPLDNNIHCGNSLIDTDDFDEYRIDTQGLLSQLDEDTQFRINRFNWTSRTHGLGRLLNSHALKERGLSGFDCIIGNPPYIRVQELKKWAPDECEFYKWRYRSAAKGNYDIYVVFVERCLDLLTPDGLLGFIMPHKFWQAKYGEGLRGILAEGKHLRSLIDFGDQQVFPGATTYTAVQVFGKNEQHRELDFAKILELTDGSEQCEELDSGIKFSGGRAFKTPLPQSSAPWVFSNASVSEWLDNIRRDNRCLGELSLRIAQGLVSGCDKVFYLSLQGKTLLSDSTGKSYKIEQDLLHSILKGSLHIRRWLPDDSKLVALFPYERDGSDWRLIEPSRMKKSFPFAYGYLLECRKKLETRERGRFAGDLFYQYSRPQNFDVMPQTKILVPSIARQGEYAPDLKGEWFYVGSGGGGGGAHAIIPTDPKSLLYLTGLLNSGCLNAFLQRVTTPFHSGWFAYSSAYIAQIPIKIPRTAEEKKLAQRITESVEAIIESKKKLRSLSLSDRERKTLEGEVEVTERHIDEAVFQLYGVKGLPEE